MSQDVYESVCVSVLLMIDSYSRDVDLRLFQSICRVCCRMNTTIGVVGFLLVQTIDDLCLFLLQLKPVFQDSYSNNQYLDHSRFATVDLTNCSAPLPLA